MSSSRRAALLVTAVCLSCAPSPTPTVAPVVERKQCQSYPNGSDVLGWIASEPCPWVLRRVGVREVEIASLAPDAGSPSRGTLPAVCADRPCTFDGALTQIGAVVIASVDGAHGESPIGAFLGFLTADRLQFVDLWGAAGDWVVEGGVDEGPPFGLEPYACGDRLGLFVAARLPSGRGTEPTRELLAREGLYEMRAAGIERADGDRNACEPLPVKVP